MNDLQQLIEITNRLCTTLTMMSENERKFGFDLCYRIEQLSWDMERSANEMKEISDYLVGGVA
jgi:hypothetical protein